MLHICIYGNFSLNMFFPHISYALTQLLYWNLNLHRCAFKILNYLIASLFYVSDKMLVSGMIPSILIILILKCLSYLELTLSSTFIACFISLVITGTHENYCKHHSFTVMFQYFLALFRYKVIKKYRYGLASIKLTLLFL